MKALLFALAILPLAVMADPVDVNALATEVNVCGQTLVEKTVQEVQLKTQVTLLTQKVQTLQKEIDVLKPKEKDKK